MLKFGYFKNDVAFLNITYIIMNIKILLKTIVNNNLCQTPTEIKKNAYYENSPLPYLLFSHQF